MSIRKRSRTTPSTNTRDVHLKTCDKAASPDKARALLNAAKRSGLRQSAAATGGVLFGQ